MTKKEIIEEVNRVRAKGLEEYKATFLSVVMNLQRKYDINTTNKGDSRNFLPGSNTLTISEWDRLYDIHCEALKICENLKNN